MFVTLLTDDVARRTVETSGLDSGHEWLLMYMAGVTPQKIAALAGVHPNAVHNTLRRFTSAVPGLKGLHLSRAPVQHSIPTRWISRLEDVLAYQSENGQLPHSRLPSAPDALLGRWLETQRRGLVAGTLNAQQIAMLDHLRTWRIGFRKAAEEERWKLRVEQLAQFYSTTGRLPSYRAADDHERMVGVWLHHRRDQTNRGMLGSRQLEALHAAAPGWRGRNTGVRIKPAPWVNCP